jgi:enoyl-[acyl-carrier protein] reductase I
MAGQGLMAGKRGLIMGVANNRSIAYGIAKACADQGAEIALTYQGDAFKKRVEPLAQELGAHIVGHCDVTDPATLDAVFAEVERLFGKIDFLVHAIAFSDKEELDGRYVDTTRANFNKTMDISVFSFTDVAKRADDLGAKNIRVNAISAGPIKTLAASGIGDFRYILKWNEYNAPLKRTVTPEEVGDSGLYFLSDLSRSVTGEVHHVDSGYHVVGMKAVDAPDISVVKE